MTRLAMTRDVDGGREVPVAIRFSGALGLVGEGLKKRAGTTPQVIGAMKDTTAVWPG